MIQERKMFRMFATSEVEGDKIDGFFTFSKNQDTVVIKGAIVGLLPGKHGIHIHDVINTKTQGHFNPFNQNHGGPLDDIKHVGDLGNIISYPSTLLSRFELSANWLLHQDLDGKVLVIHSEEDDLGKKDTPNSKSNGDSGTKIASGIIRVLS
jgi:Cu-Zn family superoxide dismutase